MTPTEAALREWRYGSVQAERLAASILRLEKYQNIEPQAPLGGADGGADILCDRGGRLWVGAVYFPTTDQSFNDIQRKFEHDLDGAISRKRHGIIFITNQRITRSDRQKLVTQALAKTQECIVYDMERIVGVLESPEGYGVRVGYLRISMSPEEQIAYFASRENVLEGAITTNSEQIQAFRLQLERLRESHLYVAHTVDTIAKAQDIVVEPLRAFDPLVSGEIYSDLMKEAPLAHLTPEMLLFVHRLVCFELPARLIGHFRKEQVYIQRAAAAPDEPTISPPLPSEVPQLIEALCGNWRERYPSLQSDDTKLEAIANFFHKLMCIHPFSDGNGRVARSLLMQQCIEFFGQINMSLFSRGVEYYEALQAADRSNLKPLKGLISRAVNE